MDGSIIIPPVEERYRSLLENIEHGYYACTVSGEITGVSAWALKISGYEEHEILGLNFRRLTTPSHAKKLLLAFNHTFKTGAPIKGLEWELIKKDGRRIPVETAATLIRDTEGQITGFHGTIKDIADRIEVLDTLRISEDKYRTIIDNIADGYYEVDLAGRLTFFNYMIPKYLGRPPDEIVGLSYKSFMLPEYLDKVHAAYHEVFVTGQSVKTIEWALRDTLGHVHDIESSISLIRDKAGNPTGFRGTIHDIADRKRANNALQQSEERYRQLAENIQDVIWIIKDLRFIFVSSAVLNQWGYRIEEILGRPLENFLPPETSQRVKTSFERALKGLVHDQDMNISYEIEMLHKDGSRLWTEAKANIIRDQYGAPTAIQGISRNITQRKLAEDALKANLNLMQILMDSIPSPIFYMNTHGDLGGCNKAFETVIGLPREQIISKPLQAVIPDDPGYRKIEHLLESEAGQMREQLEHLSFADGACHDIVFSTNRFADAAGEIIGTLGVMFDITDQKRQEHSLFLALEESRKRQAEITSLLEASHAVLINKTFDGAAQAIFIICKELINASAGFIVTYDEQSETHLAYADLPGQLADITKLDSAHMGQALEQSGMETQPFFYNTPEKNHIIGDEYGVSNALFAPLMVSGQSHGKLTLLNKPGGFTADDCRLATAFSEFAAVALINTESQRSLEVSEKRFRSVAQTAIDAVINVDDSGKIVFWNVMAEKMFGYALEDAMGKQIDSIIPEHSQQQYNLVLKKITDTIHKVMLSEDSPIGNTMEMCGLRKDGKNFPIEISISTWESEGNRFFTSIVRDITERKDLENSLLMETEELRKARTELEEAYSELKATQAQILQKEKMASIGQLAAGVAHEINNPMGFIFSNLGSLQKYIDKLMDYVKMAMTIVESHPDKQACQALEEKKKAYKVDFIVRDINELIKESLEGADRVKKIVYDLKSFSRIDQAEYKFADINECMESTVNIVWNELKYKASLHKSYGDLPKIKCFPQQINQVFMNLLVNAAQAIEKHGNISIKTWQEGHTIRASVADNGVGIPPEIIHRIFEPFFTTKDVGQGTGLGLSIAYDIVKKHSGQILVQSEPGHGTLFTVIIPFDEEHHA